MNHSFKTFQETVIDDVFITLAKLGLIAGIGYGIQNMTAHNLQESGTQTEYRRKEDELSENAKKRQMQRAQFRQADEDKALRISSRQAKLNKYRAKWNRLKAEAMRDTIIIEYSINY